MNEQIKKEAEDNLMLHINQYAIQYACEFLHWYLGKDLVEARQIISGFEKYKLGNQK